MESKIEKLKKEIERLNEIEVQLLATPYKQISLTDPDARSLISASNCMVGYYVQTAVDVDNHLIVVHKVTNVGNDRAQLTNIATQAKEALRVDVLTAVADRGYSSGEKIKSCGEADIEVYLPKSETSGNTRQKVCSVSVILSTIPKMMSTNSQPVSEQSSALILWKKVKSYGVIGLLPV